MKSVFTIEDLRDWPAATAGCEPPLRLAVIGDPVAHSKSPQMHNAALAACGISARYIRLHIRPTELRECLRLLPRAGFIGINCTIPHKAAVLAEVAEADPVAQSAGGVNTVTVGPGGKLSGTSTDGGGFARAVRECFGREIADLRVMILGAGGGAGRAIAMHCANAGCASLFLVNRTLEKLTPLLDDIAECYPAEKVAAGDLSDVFLRAGLKTSDLIVNCTSLGMKADDKSPVRAALIEPRHLVFDTIYVAHRTPLLAAADKARATGANGLAMLLHQGALSFERWFQREAPIEIMRAAIAGT